MFFDGVRNVFVVSDGAPAAGAASTPDTTIRVTRIIVKSVREPMRCDVSGSPSRNVDTAAASAP